jgi:hypothetical protein
VRPLRPQGAGAPALRARGPRACLGILARGAGAVGERRGPGAGLGALAAAFERAADPVAPVELGDALLERQSQLDLGTTLYALRSLVGVICRETGETPRSVFEAEYASSPSDDFWRANVGECS